MRELAAKIIDGRKIADKFLQKIKLSVQKLQQTGVQPTLAVLLAGDDFASKVYVANKEKVCRKAGIRTLTFVYPEKVNQVEILAKIKALNEDEEIHGILIQLPLPRQISKETILDAINPSKDVDGFHPLNVGKLVLGNDFLVPCTPAGIMALLKSEKIEIKGKHYVIVGKSDIVGKPLANMLLNQDATVTICHIETKSLTRFTQAADVLISAAGVPRLIKADMVKQGAVVLDVGFNWIADKRIVGDVDYEAVSKKAAAITPVPGGVGPMTVVMLADNVVKLAQKQGG